MPELRSNAIRVLKLWSEKQISIKPCIDTLISKFGTLEPYENEYLAYTVLQYYYWHQPSEIVALFSSCDEKTQSYALSRIADFAFQKKNISHYYNWIVSYIFAKNYFLKSNSRRALYWVLTFRPEENTMLWAAIKTVFPRLTDAEMDALLMELKNL